MNLSDQFKQAAKDYTFLLNKSYPHKTILEMVATRYSLDHFERSMLYRGISPKDKAAKRQNRLIDPADISGQVLHIDLFNALFTIAAYLRGFPVYLSNDGLLRDASESHGSEDWSDHLLKALDLTIGYLEKSSPARVNFFIDHPIEQSLTMVEKVHDHFSKSEMEYSIELHDSPDHLLEVADEGILASSDSTVIDRSGLSILDLPRVVLNFHYEPRFLKLMDEW